MALPAISAYFRLPGLPLAYQWLIIDGSLVLSYDGTSPHLGVAPTQYGFGFDVATSAGQPPIVNLDTSTISFRVPAPTGPGPCVDPVTGIPYGTGAWAVSRGSDPDPLSPINSQVSFYFCVPSSDGSHQVWAQMSYQSNWLAGG